MTSFLNNADLGVESLNSGEKVAQDWTRTDRVHLLAGIVRGENSLLEDDIFISGIKPPCSLMEEPLMPAGLAQQDDENLQTSQVLETCEVSGTGIF